MNSLQVLFFLTLSSYAIKSRQIPLYLSHIMKFINLKETFLSKYPAYLLSHSEIKSYSPLFSLTCRLSSNSSTTLLHMPFSSQISLKVEQVLSSTTFHLRKASFHPLLAVLIILCPSANQTDSLWHVSVISQISCHGKIPVESDLSEWTAIASAIAERPTMLLRWFMLRMLSCATSTDNFSPEPLAMLGQTNGLVPKIVKKLIIHTFLTCGYTVVLSNEMQGSIMTSELKSVDFIISFPTSYYSQGGGGDWERQRRNNSTQLLCKWELWEIDTLQRVILLGFSTYFTVGTIIPRKILSVYFMCCTPWEVLKLLLLLMTENMNRHIRQWRG